MEKKNLLLVLILVASTMLFAQVGIGNTDPKGILDLTNTTSNSKTHPLVVPVATKSTISSVTSRSLVAGSVYYDSGETCLKVYDGTQWNCLKVIVSSGNRVQTCGTYYQEKALAATLSANEKIGVLLLDESKIAQSSLSVDQKLIEGTNGEIITIQDTNYTGTVSGTNVSTLLSTGQYAVSIQITNPSVFNDSGRFSYLAPLGGINGLPEDECGWNLY